MTAMQWAILDVLMVAQEPMAADDIAVRMRANGWKGLQGSRIGGALASLFAKGHVHKRSIPAGEITVRGRRVKTYQMVWAMNPRAELPPRQEALL